MIPLISNSTVLILLGNEIAVTPLEPPTPDANT